MREILENIRHYGETAEFCDFTLLGTSKGFKGLMTQGEALENERILQELEDISQEWEVASNEANSQRWFAENSKDQEERDCAQVHLREDQLWLDDLSTEEMVLQNRYRDFICMVIDRLDIESVGG